MIGRQLFFISACVFALGLGGVAVAQEMQAQYVQIAEIEIDPAQLEEYKGAVREHIETAIRGEPGVLVLYSVSEKDHPTHIRAFEIYASIEAYKGAPGGAAFQKIQGGYGEDGEVVKACPNHAHYPRGQGKIEQHDSH
jgi:quinol monooxygenase YgiN